MIITQLSMDTLKRAQERFEETLDQMNVDILCRPLDQIGYLADLAHCTRT